MGEISKNTLNVYNSQKDLFMLAGVTPEQLEEKLNTDKSIEVFTNKEGHKYVNFDGLKKISDKFADEKTFNTIRINQQKIKEDLKNIGYDDKDISLAVTSALQILEPNKEISTDEINAKLEKNKKFLQDYKLSDNPIKGFKNLDLKDVEGLEGDARKVKMAKIRKGEGTSDKNAIAKQLRADLEKTKKHQGFIGGAWDWFKNKTGIGDGSDKAEKAIDKFEKGEGNAEDARNAVKEYQSGQEHCLDNVADIAASVAAVGAVAGAVGADIIAAPVSGGVSLAALPGAMAIGAGAGAATKAAVKKLDCVTGDREYDSFGKDLVTGGVCGAAAPVAEAAGAAKVVGAVGKTGGKVVSKVIPARVMTTETCEKAGEFVVKSGVTGGTFGAAGRGAEYVLDDKNENKSVGGCVEAMAEGAVDGAMAGVVIGSAGKGISKGYSKIKARRAGNGAGNTGNPSGASTPAGQSAKGTNGSPNANSKGNSSGASNSAGQSAQGTSGSQSGNPTGNSSGASNPAGQSAQGASGSQGGNPTGNSSGASNPAGQSAQGANGRPSGNSTGNSSGASNPAGQSAQGANGSQSDILDLKGYVRSIEENSIHYPGTWNVRYIKNEVAENWITDKITKGYKPEFLYSELINMQQNIDSTQIFSKVFLNTAISKLVRKFPHLKAKAA